MASFAFDPNFMAKQEVCHTLTPHTTGDIGSPIHLTSPQAAQVEASARPWVPKKGETNMEEHMIRGGFVERGEV